MNKKLKTKNTPSIHPWSILITFLNMTIYITYSKVLDLTLYFKMFLFLAKKKKGAVSGFKKILVVLINIIPAFSPKERHVMLAFLPKIFNFMLTNSQHPVTMTLSEDATSDHLSHGKFKSRQLQRHLCKMVVRGRSFLRASVNQSSQTQVLTGLGFWLEPCRSVRWHDNMQSLLYFSTWKLVKRACTCVITPGLICRGWMAGAWVTSGTVLSIRTEYPAGLLGLGGRPAWGRGGINDDKLQPTPEACFVGVAYQETVPQPQHMCAPVYFTHGIITARLSAH